MGRVHSCRSDRPAERGTGNYCARVPGTPKPSDAMTDDEYLDFVKQLYFAVREESPLYEVPAGSIDMLTTGDVRHGPWRAEDCSRVLSVWHATGWVSLYRYNDDASSGPELPARYVSALIDDPEAWVRPQAWSDVVALMMTEFGAATPIDAWLIEARR